MRAMRDGVSVKVDIPDFRRQLAEVEQRMRRRVVTGAIRDAAKVFQRAAKQRAPVLRKPDPRRIPGRLRESIVIARVRGVRGAVALRVVPRSRRATTRRAAADVPFYWVFLEGGWIPRGPGQRIAGGTRRKARERARTSYRRVQFPFLVPAFQSSQGAALSAYNAGIERRLAQVQAVK
jgi:hypothetical protein